VFLGFIFLFKEKKKKKEAFGGKYLGWWFLLILEKNCFSKVIESESKREDRSKNN
jgi:hypothetical protein